MKRSIREIPTDLDKRAIGGNVKRNDGLKRPRRAERNLEGTVSDEKTTKLVKAREAEKWQGWRERDDGRKE